MVIYPLVNRFEQILDSEDPDREINRYVRSLGRSLNETRVRLWFYLYIVFGRVRVVLHYPIHRIGRWDRLACESDVKRGRPSRKGKNYGYNVDAAMIDKLLVGYRRECGLGIFMSDIYREVMRKDFGCRSRTVKVGNRERQELYHPDGGKFPAKKAFIYHVLKAIGVRTVQETLYGSVRSRSRIRPYRGSFTEETSNLMGRVESDAAAISELPKGYVEGLPLKPLYVTIRRDTASGAKTGIGFSQGSETSNSYRMAKFCEAVDKVRFCWFFGIVIRHEQWPMIGLSPSDIQDRGPGATKGAQSRIEEFRPVINELSPSYSGQSKAVVESSHPRTPTNDDAPSYVQSELRSVELARKAIFDLLKFNETCNIGDRIPPELDGLVSRPTPIGLWQTYARLGRNDAVLIPFEEAVRAFLDKVPATLTREGIVLADRRYLSDDELFEDVRASVTGNQEVRIFVFVLESCIRTIWMDWKGRLIELVVRYRVPVESVVEYMSLSEAVQYFENCKQRDLDHEDHRDATEVGIRNEYEDQTGEAWTSGKRVSGRPKRGGAAALNENSEATAATRGRSAR